MKLLRKNTELWNFLSLMLLIVSIVIFVEGCKKENNTPPFSLIKTQTSNGTFTVTFSYDAQNRITNIASNTGQRTSYLYNGNYITYIDSDGSNITIIHSVLNNRGLTEVSWTENSGDTLHWTYDVNGHNIGIAANHSNEIKTWLNDNLENDYNAGFSDTTNYAYTYYSGKESSLTNSNYGRQFEGVDSKNLIQTETYTFNGIFTTQYSYEYDTYGRVSKRTRQANGITSQETFTYY